MITRRLRFAWYERNVQMRIYLPQWRKKRTLGRSFYHRLVALFMSVTVISFSFSPSQSVLLSFLIYIYIYSLIRWLSFASWWIVCSAMSPPPPPRPPLFLSLFLFWFILTNWIHLADFMYIYIYIHISVLWFVFFKRLLFNISSEFPATALRRYRNASPMKWMGWVPILTVICASLHSMVSDGRSDTAAAFLHHNSPASQNEFCLKIASASCMQWAIARWMTPASSSTYKINLNQ